MTNCSLETPILVTPGFVASLGVACLMLASCAASQPSGSDPPPAPTVATPTPAPAPAPVPAPAAASAAPAGSTNPAAAAPEPPCTALGCRLFDSPTQAFEAVLASKPLVLGIGEAHAQKGSEGVLSTTARFTQQILPWLAPKSSDIVIELMEPDTKCLKTAEKVREEQEPVTQEQAGSNQNEFITLGTRAKESGVQPHVLYPSCEQFDRIVKAGPDSVFVMLDTIALLTEQKAKAILLRNHKANDPRLVLLYGGAAHNDVAPRPGRESWSYAKSLQSFTKQRYVEVDLIVREYIKDTEVWQQLSWYPHFDKSTHRDKFVLFNPAPASYVLIFPASTQK